jgi:glutamine phosphoribosylpyrophosphate amidotransferase
VHNGSLSNHNSLRRQLRRMKASNRDRERHRGGRGLPDLEDAQGRTLGEAWKARLSDLDGFFTFVVGTRDGFGVVRDPIACKPAVMAETDQYVAFGSNTARWSTCPASKLRGCGSPSPPPSISGTTDHADLRSRSARLARTERLAPRAQGTRPNMSRGRS